MILQTLLTTHKYAIKRVRNTMFKFKMGFFSAPKKIPAEKIFALSLIISPLFLLTVSGWMTRIIAVCSLLAIYVLYKNRAKPITVTHKKDVPFFTKLLCATLSLPIIAILLSQSFRAEYSWAYYDSPAHILIGIFILLAIAKTGIEVVKWMSFSLPAALLLALANIIINPNLFWGSSRLSTQAVDPLAFGSLSLTFALLSLISIKLHPQSKLLIAYKIIGVCAGIYLSIASGSRTGWLAIPIIGILWLYYDHKKWSLTTKAMVSVCIVTLITSSYFLSNNIHNRVDETTKNLSQYEWKPKDANATTSFGDRVSFARMAAYLMTQRPIDGWGDGNFESIIDSPKFYYANMETRKVALISGFHNDITANMVRSGIWGLIATVALFLVPAVFFLRNLRYPNKNERDVAFMALTFLVCQFASSLSMEIFNLRYSASFFGLMIAIFCGQLLFYMSQNLPSNRVP
jgi:O-antigen ligase